MLERVPPADHPTFDSWRTATQRNQAMILRHHIETLRRLKYRPSGGFCFSWLADPSPMISTSVLDDERRPKLAWQTIVDACRPVVVITDPLPPVVAPGEALGLDVHVVNDLRGALVDATVAITCTWRGGRQQWAFRGDVDADSSRSSGASSSPCRTSRAISCSAWRSPDATMPTTRSPRRAAPAPASS